MGLTPDQRRALDGEHEGHPSVVFRQLGLPPEAIAESRYDPGMCQERDSRDWGCGLTAHHDDDCYYDRPPPTNMGV